MDFFYLHLLARLRPKEGLWYAFENHGLLPPVLPLNVRGAATACGSAEYVSIWLIRPTRVVTCGLPLFVKVHRVTQVVTSHLAGAQDSVPHRQVNLLARR